MYLLIFIGICSDGIIWMIFKTNSLQEEILWHIGGILLIFIGLLIGIFIKRFISFNYVDMIVSLILIFILCFFTYAHLFEYNLIVIPDSFEPFFICVAFLLGTRLDVKFIR